MTPISLEELTRILRATPVKAADPSLLVSEVTVHSGQVPPAAVFFALSGTKTDGHRYVGDALTNGAMAVVVSRQWQGNAAHNVLVVDDPLQALQDLAAWWRGQCHAKILAIAGSQGKTMAKEAIRHLLSAKYRCYASPGSFNSQLGVPLAILRMPPDAEFGVFESSVSEPGEMASHAKMLKPDFGVLTNVGWAHLASFGSRYGVAIEQLRLFEELPDTGWLLIPGDDALLDEVVRHVPCSVFRPGTDIHAEPSTQGGSLNATSAARGVGHLLGMTRGEIDQAMADYMPQLTRKEVWKSPGGVTVINDTDASDSLSVGAALRSMQTLSSAEGRRFFLFGGMQDRTSGEVDYAQVGVLAAKAGVDELLLLGSEALGAVQASFTNDAPSGKILRLSGTREAKEYLLPRLRWGDCLLIKGPAGEGVASVARDIVEGMAPTRFYIDLKAISENIQRLRSHLHPGTQMLAMVKALGYGTDSIQLSHELQAMGVDSIGVSSADEGVQLRRAGIGLPILVMMCTRDEVEKLPRYGLTPVLYSLEIASAVAQAAIEQRATLDVHIEVDTGMGRTGIQPGDLMAAVHQVAASGCLRFRGLMTHFPAADMPEHDEFTLQQVRQLKSLVAELHEAGCENFLVHASATSGAIRLGEAQFDMVRVGLGLYGVYPSPPVEQDLELVLAVAFVSRIVEIQNFRLGSTIGYGRTFVVERADYRGAIVPAGYHDGVPWKFAERGYVLVSGKRARVCGRISMDSMVVDVSDIEDADVGSEVLIYGRRDEHSLRPEDSAEAAGTIPYELLARVGPRVQRIFIGR